ncbi:YjaG family protein [Colwellia sp. 1_MG-2023]|uniref:YjaG family protein n=1 Tax=Colwellia sp. 1_MG-2023 TaxID=3062649 RepID=UPI0026E2678C|nr:YjaG family protein [Colwellia sp. 1_MG-2023]MDO6446763.1 YjaG family protein [Colwellia sp. 1_MG-2023]
MSIHIPLTKLTQWQKIAFCVTLIERMLPNYKAFSENSGFGNFQLIRNQLDLIWQRLDKSQKVNINYDAQLLKLEEQVPDPQAFDLFGVYPALDTSMAVMSLLQAMQDKEGEGFESISRLSQGSVNFYVELCLAQELDESNSANTEEISQQLINEHPLMEWEAATQNELFDFLKNSPENKATIKALKNMVSEQGLSNLGIEIQ